MKLRCPCGHVISDTTDYLPYKASLLADQDEEAFWGSLSSGLAGLMAATRSGGREEWQRHHLNAAPLDLDDESLISDFATSVSLRYMRTVYQCEQCGRLLLEDPANEGRVVSFAPEDAGIARHVLESKQKPSK